MAINKTRKRGPGRPPLGGESMEQIAIRLPKSTLDAIDNIRLSQLDPPDRSAVIRRLLAEALKPRGKR